MDAVDTKTPGEHADEALIIKNFDTVSLMFKPFTARSILEFDHTNDCLFLKGEDTVLQVPLSKITEYLRRAGYGKE